MNKQIKNTGGLQDFRLEDFTYNSDILWSDLNMALGTIVGNCILSGLSYSASGVGISQILTVSDGFILLNNELLFIQSQVIEPNVEYPNFFIRLKTEDTQPRPYNDSTQKNTVQLRYGEIFVINGQGVTTPTDTVNFYSLPRFSYALLEQNRASTTNLPTLAWDKYVNTTDLKAIFKFYRPILTATGWDMTTTGTLNIPHTLDRNDIYGVSGVLSYESTGLTYIVPLSNFERDIKIFIDQSNIRLIVDTTGMPAYLDSVNVKLIIEYRL